MTVKKGRIKKVGILLIILVCFICKCRSVIWPGINYRKYIENSSRVCQFEDPFAGKKSILYDIFMNNKNMDTDKWHHYFPIYEKHFSKYRNRPVNVLEIGVSKGGSLRMWKKYFGKESRIFGADIDPGCKKLENLSENIEIIIGDQSDPKFLQELMRKLPKIDILIDDGGHTTGQQITTFLECYDKIADDGIYLCEDLHTNYWDSYIDTDKTFIELAKDHIDSLNAWFFGKNKNVDARRKGNYKDIPVFTGITHSITFYNSIIVFEKSKQCEPFSELR